MLVAHLCQYRLVLFPQVYKGVQVPWMGNPSVISPFLCFGEWCSSSYVHFLLPSHCCRRNLGRKRLLCIFSLAVAQAGFFFQLHHISIELMRSSGPEGCQIHRHYEHQHGLPWASTSVDYADSCLEETQL